MTELKLPEHLVVRFNKILADVWDLSNVDWEEFWEYIVDEMEQALNEKKAYY